MKYVVFGIILFLLITYIPITKINNNDRIIIYVVAICSFIAIDIILNYNNIQNICSKFFGKKIPKCNCNNIEQFTNNNIDNLLQNISDPVLQNTTTIPVLQNTTTIPVLQNTTTIPVQQNTTTIPVQQNTATIPVQQNTTTIPVQQNTATIPVLQNIVKQNNEADTSNEMKYTELPPEMHQPLGSYDNTFTNDFNHGYTLLNTDKWSVPMKRPPVCIQEKECPVCPSMTTGSFMYVKDFPMETHIPEKINMDYVNDKINKTR
jgi:hypothetical protein